MLSAPSNIVEMYDPSSNTWSVAAPMLAARSLFAVADANGVIYAIGGVDNNFTDTFSVEQYLPSTSFSQTLYTFLKN